MTPFTSLSITGAACGLLLGVGLLLIYLFVFNHSLAQQLILGAAVVIGLLVALSPIGRRGNVSPTCTSAYPGEMPSRLDLIHSSRWRLISSTSARVHTLGGRASLS